MDSLADRLGEVTLLLEEWGIRRQLINSAVLLAAFFVFRWGIVYLIGRWNAPRPEDKRRWIVQARNISLLFLAVGLSAVWLSELRAFAVSLVVVASAVAIVTKELIQCFLGSAYKTSARPFELGDRIEVNGVRGEVIDHNLFATTLMEIGPMKEVHQHSGRQVAIPNSWLLFYPVYNQSIQHEYILHNIRIPLTPGEDWKATEETLLQAANHECAHFLEPARWSMVRLGQVQGLDLPRVEPRVNFQILEGGAVHALLRVPVLASVTSKTEQAIIRRYLEKRRPHERSPEA